MKIEKILIGGAALILLAAPAKAASGIAKIVATSTSSAVSGLAFFTDTGKGLEIKVQVKNAPAGNHGFHIHEFGSCEDMGKAAGGHYNPMASPHGQILKDGPHKAHAGDLGNFKVEPNGTGSLEAVIPGITLAGGANSVGGRALIFHEKLDDFGQPVGNAGGRIGCGIIVITGN